MTLDTNILIAYLNGEANAVVAVSDWVRDGRALFISSVSVAEALALPGLTPQELDRVRKFLKNFISIPFDDALAETTAFLKRIYRFSLPDAAIAATAISRGTPLVTRDRKFGRIRGITVISI